MIQSAKQANKVFLLLLVIGLGLTGLDQLGLIQAQTATVTSTRSILIVDTVADLANLTPIDGTIVQTRGYNTAGDGGGNTYRYSKTDTTTADGGFYLNGPNSIGRYVADNKDSEVINIRQFGATGDGTTDDTEAIQNAFTNIGSNSRTLYFPVGTYNCETWEALAVTGDLNVTLSPDAVLTGTWEAGSSDTTESFITISGDANVDIRGGDFRSFYTLIYRGSQTSGNPVIEVVDATISDCRVGVYITHFSSDVTGLEKAYIKDCDISDFEVYGIAIHATKNSDIRVESNFVHDSQSTSLDTAIRVGYEDDPVVLPHSGLSCAVTNNTVSNITKTAATGATNITVRGILCYFGNALVSDNTIKNVSVSGPTATTTVGASGIYIRSDHAIVSGNIIHNAGMDEAAITLKGITYSESVVSGNVIISDEDDDSRYGTGISNWMDNVSITDNVIVNKSGFIHIGIRCADGASNCLISANRITGMSDVHEDPIGIVVGITADNVVIQGNVIEDFEDNNTQSARVGVLAVTSSVSKFVVSNNTIRRLGTQNSHGVWLDNVSGVNCSILNNVIEECATSIRCRANCDYDVIDISGNRIAYGVGTVTHYGVWVDRCVTRLTVSNNIISDLDSDTAACYAINIRTESSSDTVSVIGNVIERLSSSHASDDGVAVVVDTQDGCDSLVIRSNYITTAGKGISVLSSNIVGDGDLCCNRMLDVDSSQEIVFTGTPSAAFIVEENLANGIPTGNRTVRAFADSDTTPSIGYGVIYKTANTGATTISDFDDGTEGQELTVLIQDGNTTIDFTSSGLIGNGGSDWSPADGDSMNCVYDGTDWICIIHDNTP